MKRDLITKSKGDPYNERLFFRYYPFNKITYTKIERSRQSRPNYAQYAFNLRIDTESENSFPFKKINYIRSEADLSEPRFSKNALFMQVQEAVRRGQTSTAIRLAISQGIKDKNLLTDLIFHARHPERRGKRIQGYEQALVKEWLDIKNRLVEPAISSTMYNAPSKPTAGAPLPASPILSGITVIHVRHKVNTYENGVLIEGTQKTFKAFYRDEMDVMLGAVFDVEGRYDTVNMYDVGILSWGISQWTLHQGSLQKALYFIRTELINQKKSELWNTLFPNLDVEKLEGNNYRILYKGKSLKTNEELRNTFRGSALRGEYKKEIIEYWAGIFANAGRNETIIRLQNELGRKEIAGLYNRNVGEFTSKFYKSGKTKFGPNYKYRVIDYLDRSLKTKLLFYGMWVQNPGGIYLYLKRAIDKIKEEYGNYNIEKWPLNWQNRFEEIFENLLLHSQFAMWGREKAAAAKPKPRKSRTDKLLEGYEKYKKEFRL